MGGWVLKIYMLTVAYGGYGCVVRKKNAYGCFYGGGGWCVWFDFDQRQVQFQYHIEKHTCSKIDDINLSFTLL